MVCVSMVHWDKRSDFPAKASLGTHQLSHILGKQKAMFVPWLMELQEKYALREFKVENFFVPSDGAEQVPPKMVGGFGL